jgi:hypothetical protein
MISSLFLSIGEEVEFPHFFNHDMKTAGTRSAVSVCAPAWAGVDGLVY